MKAIIKNKKRNKKRIIAFDLDGTLIDSIPLHCESFIYGAKCIGLKMTEKDFKKLPSSTAERMIRQFYPDISPEQVIEFIKKKNEHLFKNISKLKPFPDTIKTLTELKKDFKIIIISNTPFKEVLQYLEYAGLNPFFFDMIIGRDLVKNPKPEPDEIFLAEKIQRAKIDFYVGDSIIDIKTGKKANVKTIAVTTGFNTRKELLKEKPYKVASSLTEVLEIIKSEMKR